MFLSNIGQCDSIALSFHWTWAPTRVIILPTQTTHLKITIELHCLTPPPKWVVEWSMSKFYFHLQKLWMPSFWIYTWAKLMHDESASMPIGIFAASASGWEKNEQAAMCGTVLTLMKDHVMPKKGEMAPRNHTSFLLKPMLAIWLKIGLAQYNPTWKLKTKYYWGRFPS